MSLNNIEFFAQNIPQLLEVSIGHALVCESLYLGFENVIQILLAEIIMKILHSKIIGSGNNHVIVLHGFLGMGDNWKSLGKQFFFDFEVHLIDQRNHGTSFHSPKMNYDLMVEDVYNYLESHKIKRCVIMGHSMGGKVAMKFSLSHSQYLKKLIIIDIAPKKYEAKFSYLFEIIEKYNLEKIKTNIKQSKEEFAYG